MSKFNVGDRVRSLTDERQLVKDNPILMALCNLAGNGEALRRSLQVMPEPRGTVIATDATFVHPALGTMHGAILVDLDDGRKNFPYDEEDLELIQSFDDELTALLEAGK